MQIYDVTHFDGFANHIGPMTSDALEQHLHARTLENTTPRDVLDTLRARGKATLYFLPPVSLLRTRVEIRRA